MYPALLNTVKNEGCRGGVQARFKIQKEQGAGMQNGSMNLKNYKSSCLRQKKKKKKDSFVVQDMDINLEHFTRFLSPPGFFFFQN
jgi:hypothetical protein